MVKTKMEISILSINLIVLSDQKEVIKLLKEKKTY